MSKICSKCQISPKKDSSVWCQECINQNNRENWNKWPQSKQREKWLKKKYKLSWQQYVDIFISQNECCAICLTPVSIESKTNSRYTACVDHCHDTGQVRGILCNHCNRALGLLKDNINSIQNMVKYLGKYQ